jgi:hypothetical protein
MKKILKGTLVGMIGLSLTIAIGCATQQTMSKTGFLQDYTGFKPGPKGGADFVYFKEGVDFSAYNKVMVDHVVFYFKEDSAYKGIHADEMKELADAFHGAIAEALKDGYPLVDKSGPGVLRIRAAITDVVPSKPALNTISTILPVGLAISSIKRGATGVHASVGQASIEAELMDSQTNERLGAAIDTKAAEKYKLIKGISKWGHVKDAFKFWANRLRIVLDKAHGKKT